MALQSHGHGESHSSRSDHNHGENGATGGAPSHSSSGENNSSVYISSNIGTDDVDGADSSHNEKQKTKIMIEQLQTKIQRTMDQIKDEQNAKEENVNEYLKVSTSSSVDRQQLQRIKKVFETKNQKSTQMVSQLQKKLDNYKRRLKDVQHHGASGSKPSSGHKQALRQGLKDVGANIKDGISGFSGGVVDNIRGAKDSIVAKPKEFAHLIKNRYKFGSADNITSLKLEDAEAEDTEKRSHPGSANVPLQHSSYHKMPSEEDACSDNLSGSGLSGNHSSPNPQSLTAFQTADHEIDLEPFFKELQINREGQQRLQDSIDSFKCQWQSEYVELKQLLTAERFRNERLDEQLNELTELHHDLTELHQHEITNIKQELAGMEEKMEYQLEERTRDMQELLETCQTRITKMELQQQQQQLISMEGIENSNFRALITKLINVALAVLAVVLVLVSTIANMLSPFLTTRFRILSTVLFIASMLAAWQNWDSLKHYADTFVDHYQSLVSKFKT